MQAGMRAAAALRLELAVAAAEMVFEARAIVSRTVCFESCFLQKITALEIVIGAIDRTGAS